MATVLEYQVRFLIYCINQELIIQIYYFSKLNYTITT